MQWINPEYLKEIAALHSVEWNLQNEQQRPMSQEKKKFIEENIHCSPSVPPEKKDKYWDLVKSIMPLSVDQFP